VGGSALTLPYYFAINGITSIADATFPEVFAGALGASSNTDASLYELWGEVTLADGSLEWQSLAVLNIVGRAELAGTLAAAATSTGVTFSSFVGSPLPEDGGFALIGGGAEEANEIALIAGTVSPYTLSRGMLDTVPRAWPAGTPVWFIAQDTLIEDPTVRSAAEIVNYRLRMRTSLGLLNLYAAPILTYTLTERPWLPSRPANVVAYGDAFSSSSDITDARARPNPWVTVTWSNRNRLTEDGTVLDWTEATVTPETGQTTTIDVLKTDGVTSLASHTGLTGTSFNVPNASFGSDTVVILRTSASRTDADGTFESLQSFDHWVRVANAAGVEAASGAGAFSGAGAGIRAGSLSGSGTGAMSGVTGGPVAAALSASATGAFAGGGGTGNFVPSDLASLVAWYNADTIAGSNGTVLSAWNDSKGSNNASGGNVTSPSLVTSAVNGHQAVAWDGGASTQALSLGTTLMVGETAGSFFAAFKRTADPPASGKGGAILDGFTADTSGSKNAHHPYTDGVIYEHFGMDIRTTVGNPTPSLTSFRIYSAHQATNDIRAYLDGTSLFSGGAGSTAHFGTGVTKRIGANAAGDRFEGQIAEICIFNSALTTSDRQKVEGYLAWKYGLQANLPGGHPYLSSPP
jgi:hypothetical protein